MEQNLQDEMRKKYAKIVAKAWADEDFKKNLIANPKEILKQEGFEIPDNKTIKISENTDTQLNFILPVKPDDLKNISEIDKRLVGMNNESGCQSSCTY